MNTPFNLEPLRLRAGELGNILKAIGIGGAVTATAVPKGFERSDKMYGDDFDRLNRIAVGTNMTENTQPRESKFASFRAKKEKLAQELTNEVNGEKRAFLNALLQGIGAFAGQAGQGIPLTPGGSFVAGITSPMVGGTTRGLMGLTKPIADVAGYNIYKSLFPGMGGMLSYTQAPETALKSTLEGFGKGMGEHLSNAISNMATDIMAKHREFIEASPMRKALLSQLRQEDQLIKKMDLKVVLEAYHSMIKVAPTLSLDKNAVKSFLRSVAMAPEGGIDWNTLKGLADAEASINKAHMKQ